MKLKKLLALTLTGAMLTATLTACTPLDAAEIMYDAVFGGGSSSTGSNNGGNDDTTGGNGGSSSDDKNDNTLTGSMTVDEKDIADTCKVSMLNSATYDVDVKVQYFPETEKIKKLFKSSWMENADGMVLDISRDEQQQIKSILSAYGDYYDIQLRALEVTDSMNLSKQARALELVKFGACHRYLHKGEHGDWSPAEVRLSVSTVTSGGKTYRLLFVVTQY